MEVSVSLADGKDFSLMWEVIDPNCSSLRNGAVSNVHVCMPDLAGKMEVRVSPVTFLFFFDMMGNI